MTFLGTLPIGAGSGLVDGQLVAVPKSNTLTPPANLGVAVQTAGAAPTTLPDYSIQGGATNGPSADATASTSVSSNPWQGPLLQNPLFWVLALLAVGYLMLRYINYAPRS